MSMMSKQVSNLRAYAKERRGELAKMIADAANTIEVLSAKLAAANMERSSMCYHGGWIPVSERLPELDDDGYSEKVLVCFNQTDLCEICEYRVGQEETPDGWYAGDTDDRPEDVGLRVTAWMPLPNPWRGEDHESD